MGCIMQWCKNPLSHAKRCHLPRKWAYCHNHLFGDSAMRLLILALLFPLLASANEPRRLPVGRLGIDFVFTGIAGIPLGQTFDIEASAVDNPDRDAPKGNRRGYLKVTSVNGRKLKEPEEI